MKEPSANYLARPRFKQTEVGMIPEEWTLSNLATLSAFITKGSTPTTYGFKWQQEGILFLRSECVSENGLDLSQSMYISDAAHAALRRSQINGGDLLITITGNVGRVILFMNSARANINQHIARVRIVAPEASRDFVYHFLSLPQCRARFTSITTGQAYPQISLKQVREAPVPIPPTKAEQEAIAEALSDADALIESLDQLLVKKRHLKQGAMQELLHPNKGYVVRPLGEVSSLKGRIGWQGLKQTEFTTNGDEPFLITGMNFKDGAIRWSEVYHISEARYAIAPEIQLRPNDVLMTKDGTIGKVLYIDAIPYPGKASLNSHLLLFRPTGASYNPKYLYYQLGSQRFKDFVELSKSGTTFFGLSQAAVAAYPLLLPPLPEQEHIATILSDMDSDIATIEEKLTKARQLKQGMMQELLTGRIRLVQSKTNVAQLLSKNASVLAPSQSHNWAINEAVVISVLAKNFGSEQWPLGRKRCTKLSYLLHRHVEGQAEGYLKKAAGPYNPATKYKGPEGIALKNGYIQRHSRDRFSGFIAAEKIAEAESYFTKWYGRDALDWLEQFRVKTNDELELLATIDMALVDLRKANKAEQLANVKRVIRDHPEWEAKLSRAIFSDDRIIRAMKSCQKLFGSEE